MRPGDPFDRFEIVAQIGEGGMGRVFRARDPKLGREVAIKLLPAGDGSDESRQRMLREARAAAGISHPNAVAVYDVGEDPESGPFIIMELVDGTPLRSRIADGSTPLETKLAWLDEIAAALGAAHDKGVVHRDIKPENVVVTRAGAAKVLDFGIAKQTSSQVDASAPTQSAADGGALATLTAQGVQVGTPVYMAPEQIKGDPVDPRTDQFAWGVVAYELLSGKPPWTTEKGALGLVASILTDVPAPIEGVDPTVEAVVLRALSKERSERFGSMAELRAALTGPGAMPAQSARKPARPPEIVGPSKGYDTETLKAIFERALVMENARGKYQTSDLVEAAREMGIDEATVLEAARDVERAANVPDVEKLRAEKRKKRRESFFSHLGAYLIVNTFLYLMGGGLNRMVLLGWGMGLAFHLWGVLFPKERSDEDLLEEALAKRAHAEKRKRRHEVKPGEIEEGARALLSTTARRAAAGQRVRVAASSPEPSSALAAEEEAAALQEEARPRQRANR